MGGLCRGYLSFTSAPASSSFFDFLRIRFASGSLNDRRCTFNHFFGLFQTEAGDATYLLNYRNFL